MESYSTTPHPGDMIVSKQSMMKQQHSGMWGMPDQQQPGSNMSQGMSSIWMSQQPDVVSSQRPSTSFGVDAGVDRDPVQTAFIVPGKKFTQTGLFFLQLLSVCYHFHLVSLFRLVSD